MIHAPRDEDDLIRKMEKKVFPGPLPKSVITNNYSLENLSKKLRPLLSKKQHKWLDKNMSFMTEYAFRLGERKRSGNGANADGK